MVRPAGTRVSGPQGLQPLDDPRERAAENRRCRRSVVDQPTETRRLWRASTPIASRTGEGSRASQEHALPECAATPDWSSPSTTASASTPATPKHTMCGTRSRSGRRSADDVVVPELVVDALGAPSRLVASCCWRVLEFVADRRPTPGSAPTFSSPARRARSWSPPSNSGSSRRPRRTSNAPMPTGPPSFGRADRHQVDARVRRSRSGRGRRPAAASTWRSTPRAWHSADHLVDRLQRRRLRGWPTGSARARRRRRSASRDRGPRRCVRWRRRRARAPRRVVPTASRTAECSTAAATNAPPGVRRAAPKQAALIASVAPLVNTTSRGRAPNNAATCSRASSSAARAMRPSVWTRPGSPVVSSHSTQRGARRGPQAATPTRGRGRRGSRGAVTRAT